MSATKEHYHGKIEHETRFEYQGKRKDQYEKAAKIYFWACVAILIIVIVMVALGIEGY